MLSHLKAFAGRSFLCEPFALKQALARLEKFPTCPTMREVGAARKAGLDEARGLAASAVGDRGGAVGIIPIYGIIEQRMSPEMMKLGGTSTEEVSAALDVMAADPNIASIVLDVDSPGGGVFGVEELGDKIHQVGKSKPIHAVANSMAASAGYWIASQASRLSTTPGGQVGSVGVYTFHVDESKALEEDGLVVTVIQAGKYKTELLSHQPLSKEAKAWAQEQWVNDPYKKFVGAVARGRNTTPEFVLSDYGQGRLLSAEQALKAGAVDAVATFDAVVNGALASAATQARRMEAANAVRLLRLRHQARKRSA